MSMKRGEFDANVAPATNFPRNLYHYCPFKWLENILANDTLYFQSAADVNDPFDCQLHPKYGEHAGKKGEDHAASHRGWEDRVRKKLGLFCLSEVNNDILMWSHYGDKHRGVVLQFDGYGLSKHFLNQEEGFIIFSPVKYREDWPEIGHYKAVWDKEYEHPSDENKAILRAMVFLRKALHWCYEREWRIVLEESGFKHIDPGALTGIILGCKMNDADCEKVLGYKEKYKKEDIALFKAKESPDRYSLDIEVVGDILGAV